MNAVEGSGPLEPRHLDVAGFAEALRDGYSREYRLPGVPELALFIDTASSAIGLRIPADPRAPRATTDRENLHVREVQLDTHRFTELRVTEPTLFIDAYPLLCAVADRIQLEHRSASAAISETVSALGMLLERDRTLRRETELGLYGELCFLKGLLRLGQCWEPGPDAAVSFWHGPDREEHDFALPGFDVEVKTTSTERRLHWISSLTQLIPSPGRPLYIISLQLTSAGQGAGRRLPELIAEVRQLLGGRSSSTSFESALYAAGWVDAYAATCQSRFSLRTPPLVAAVAEGFPRLTPSLLANADFPSSAVTEVKYRIDLSGQAAAPFPPQPLSTVLQEGTKI